MSESAFYDCPHCGAGGIIPDEDGRCTNCNEVLVKADSISKEQSQKTTTNNISNEESNTESQIAESQHTELEITEEARPSISDNNKQSEMLEQFELPKFLFITITSGVYTAFISFIIIAVLFILSEQDAPPFDVVTCTMIIRGAVLLILFGGLLRGGRYHSMTTKKSDIAGMAKGVIAAFCIGALLAPLVLYVELAILPLMNFEPEESFVNIGEAMVICGMFGVFFMLNGRVKISSSKESKVTKPLQKKEIEEVEENETIKKPSPEVLCKGCGKPLGQAQIDYMLGNPQYQKWCREGFCNLACFEKHKDL